MSAISLSAALPLLCLALAYALKGGRNAQAWAVAVLPLVGLPLIFRYHRRRIFAHPTIRPILAFLLWSILLLLAAPPIYAHLNRLSVLVACSFMAAAATGWTDSECRIFIGLVTAIGVVEAVSFLYLRLRFDAQTGYLYGNPIYSALAMAAGLLALSVFVDDRRNSSLVPFAVLLTIVLAITRSRSTLLGFLAALALIAPRRRYFTGLGVLAAVSLVVAVLSPHAVLAYLKVDFARPENIFGRWTIWKTALSGIWGHPVLGWGLGNFESAYLKYQLPIDTVLHYDRSTIFAHNDLLQVAVETGGVGAAAAVWSLVAFSRAVRGSLDDHLTRWSAAIMVLYTVAGLFNVTLFLPYNGLVAAAAFGIGARRCNPTEQSRPAFAETGGWAILAGFLLVFTSLNGLAEAVLNRGRPVEAARLLPCRSELWYEAALDTLNSGGSPTLGALQEARRFLDRAVHWNPQDAFAWDRLAMVEMSIPDRTLDPAADFSRAIDLAPCHAPFWIDSGFERLRAGDLSGAEDRFNRASALEPNAPMPWFALAVAAKERGDYSKADQLVAKASDLRRQYASAIAPSGYANYLFGMTDSQMRAAISSGRPARSRNRD